MSRARRPTPAQAYAMARAIYRNSDRSSLRSFDDAAEGIADVTVAAILRNGWAESVRFYDDERSWRWQYFTVSEAGKALHEVIAEIEQMRAFDASQAHK